MSTITDSQASTAPVPFFEDTRTLTEKLLVAKREWRPHQPKEKCPDMVFGLVTERDVFISSYGNKEPVPTARLLTKDNVEWSIVGFHGFLKSELDRKDPRPGDFAAFAYKGTKPAKKAGESDAYDYQVEVERNPDREVEAEVAVAEAAVLDERPGRSDGDASGTLKKYERPDPMPEDAGPASEEPDDDVAY